MACCCAACYFVQVPADQRWYVRFPRAAHNDSGLECLPYELKNTHWFFATHECPDEVQRERLWLARPSLFPEAAIAHTPAKPLQERTWFVYRIEVEDVWSSIYGKREDRSGSPPGAPPAPE